MSLATIEADMRNDAEALITHAKAFIDDHLPKLAAVAEKADADAAKAENDPVIQALESVFLDNDEKTLIASLITKLGTLAKDADAVIAGQAGGAESDGDASGEPAQPGIPDGAPDPQPQTGVAV